MASQQQDLACYKDHSVTQVAQKSLSLISHVQGTAPTWLVSGLIENYLFDTCNVINSSSASSNYSLTETRSRVIVFSFINDTTPYEKYFNKVNLPTTGNANFKFVELLSEIYEGEDNVFKKIKQELALFDKRDGPLNIFIESPESILHTTSIEINKYLAFLQSLQKTSTNLILISSIGANLINFHSTSRETIEFRHTDFITKIIHKSNIIFNLKPLETGRADDVTGTLTITKGPIDILNVVEREYLYLINKEGYIKLFYR